MKMKAIVFVVYETIRNIYKTINLYRGEASPHILLKLVIQEPVRRDARRLCLYTNILRNHSLIPDYPVGQRMPAAIEVDANLHYRKPTEGEAFGVLLQVDLAHRRIGILIELQLNYI